MWDFPINGVTRDRSAYAQGVLGVTRDRSGSEINTSLKTSVSPSQIQDRSSQTGGRPREGRLWIQLRGEKEEDEEEEEEGEGGGKGGK